MQDMSQWKIPSGDTTEIRRGSRKREGGPGGNNTSGKDRSGLDDVRCNLVPGKPRRLRRTFGVFQFIPFSLEVVEMTSTCLIEWLD